MLLLNAVAVETGCRQAAAAARQKKRALWRVED